MKNDNINNSISLGKSGMAKKQIRKK